jgi:hypothetical protein
MATAIEGGGLETTVVLNGYNDFKKKLKAADADMRKAMDKEIKSFITPVSSLAKSYVPSVAMRNWKSGGQGVWSSRLGWDQSEVLKGIVVRQGGSRSKGSATSAAWRIQNKSAAGAVYELAGKKDTSHSASLVRELHQQHHRAWRSTISPHLACMGCQRRREINHERDRQNDQQV